MKKRIVISILTAFALLLSAPVTIHANAILGDVNYDSVLDVNDAYAILEPVQYLFKERKKWYNGINKTGKVR
ncbi:MAG: hypothetical protein K2H82_00805, partial [Oscillospiraceae bacterium]|nr:hypothetical protein [Oscillospiraceae bacterium]